MVWCQNATGLRVTAKKWNHFGAIVALIFGLVPLSPSKETKIANGTAIALKKVRIFEQSPPLLLAH